MTRSERKTLATLPETRLDVDAADHVQLLLLLLRPPPPRVCNVDRPTPVIDRRTQCFLCSQPHTKLQRPLKAVVGE